MKLPALGPSHIVHFQSFWYENLGKSTEWTIFYKLKSIDTKFCYFFLPYCFFTFCNTWSSLDDTTMVHRHKVSIFNCWYLYCYTEHWYFRFLGQIYGRTTNTNKKYSCSGPLAFKRVGYRSNQKLFTTISNQKIS